MDTRTLLIFTIILLLGGCLASKKNYNKPMSKKEMASYEAMIMKMQNASIGTPDPKVGELLSAMKPGDGNPEEMGSYLEGDILTVQSDAVPGRPNFRWPNNLVHYSIDGSFNRQQRNLILSAMSQIQRYTCIRFQQQSNEVSYISIQNLQTGCWSSIGRTGRKQTLNLQTPEKTGIGCLHNIGTTIHELMHALGIDHEQSRSDRDNHVNINWNNINAGHEHNFEKQRLYKGLGVGYDYNSVMHYSLHAFSKNGKPTITPKRRSRANIGQRRGLSNNDVSKINRLYNCKTRSWDAVWTEL